MLSLTGAVVALDCVVCQPPPTFTAVMPPLTGQRTAVTCARTQSVRQQLSLQHAQCH